MESRCKILACQVEIPAMAAAGDRDNHLHNLKGKISGQLAAADADLVVLPELSSIDYSRSSFDNLDELAEPLDGPSYEVMSAIAKDHSLTIVYGIARKHEGRFYISQVVVGPTGDRIGYFDKLHIAHYGASPEKDYFSRGQNLFTFSCKGLIFAPIICYDIRIPELTRSLVLDHGTQVLLHCGAYARDESFYSWHPFVITRAMENQIFVLSLNRAGANFGHSLFCTPWVDERTPETCFPQRKEAFLRFELDGQDIQETKRRYSFLADKMPNYKSLTLVKVKS
ncbi:MAG: carbon-nitrogen hydrolase family protein [Pseudomonadota bacterium]